MPVSFPSFPGVGDSRPTLAKFVLAVRDFIDELVGYSPNAPASAQSLSKFHESLRSDILSAWLEARPQFDEVATAIPDLPDDTIQQHGLRGFLLRFKLRAVEFFHEKYQRLGGVGPLKKLIDTIDTLLESILDAVGVGGGISEIKDFLKHSLED